MTRLFLIALLSSTIFAQTTTEQRPIFRLEQCPDTIVNQGQGCQCSLTVQWSCPAGFFCPQPNLQFTCPLGMYCPPNTYNPIFCCGGYFCRDPTIIKPCPDGHVCQVGTITPKPCALGACERFTDQFTKTYSFLIFLGVVVLLFFGNMVKTRVLRARNSRFQQRFERVMSSPKVETLVKEKGIQTFDIQFDNIGMVLPNGLTIMKNVSGTFASGRTCAIMGPSGAGKTTLISLLTGKAKLSSGKITINGQEDSLKHYAKLIGFVPQEDIMIRCMTVRRILQFSALTRLPSSWPSQRKDDKVIQTIDYLGLSHVMDSIIGNDESRGISGGQRRRVSIGMELVAEPSILFLDEPTSGLDSSTAVEVCQLLKNIARQRGMTVAAVIHSPSQAAYSQFDDLMLLGKGGQVIYQGPVDDAPAYFDSIGFPVPANANPADFYMDVASGKLHPKSSNEPFHPADLFSKWQEHLHGRDKESTTIHIPVEDDMDGRSTHVGTNAKAAFADAWEWIKDVASEMGHSLVSLFSFRKDPVRDTPNSFSIFYLCLKRAMQQYTTSPVEMFLIQMLHFGCGLFISLATSKAYFLGPMPDELCNLAPVSLQAKCRFPQNDLLRSVCQFICWAIGFAGIAVGAGTFGNEKTTYWRERQAGIPALPYFVAKMVADLPRILTASIMFMLAFVLGYNNDQSFLSLFAIVYLLYVWGFSCGYAVSALAPRTAAPLVGVVFALVWAIGFSGVDPTIASIRDDHPNLMWMYAISVPRWAISAFYRAEVSNKVYQNTQVALKIYGYQDDGYYTSLVIILGISLGWQLLAMLAFKLLNRNQQK